MVLESQIYSQVYFQLKFIAISFVLTADDSSISVANRQGLINVFINNLKQNGIDTNALSAYVEIVLDFGDKPLNVLI